MDCKTHNSTLTQEDLALIRAAIKEATPLSPEEIAFLRELIQILQAVKKHVLLTAVGAAIVLLFSAVGLGFKHMVAK